MPEDWRLDDKGFSQLSFFLNIIRVKRHTQLREIHPTFFPCLLCILVVTCAFIIFTITSAFVIVAIPANARFHTFMCLESHFVHNGITWRTFKHHFEELVPTWSRLQSNRCYSRPIFSCSRYDVCRCVSEKCFFYWNFFHMVCMSGGSLWPMEICVF